MDSPLTPIGPDPKDAKFNQLEALAQFWKDLERCKWRLQQAPQLEPIIEGATVLIRLEIILLCRDILEESPRHTLD